MESQDGLGWVALGCIGLRWVGLGCVGLRWVGLGCVELRWVALGWVGGELKAHLVPAPTMGTAPSSPAPSSLALGAPPVMGHPQLPQAAWG